MADEIDQDSLFFSREGKAVFLMGSVLLIVGRLAGEIGTWEMLKYFGIAFAAATALSLFSDRDSVMKMVGWVAVCVGLAIGAGYAFYHYVVKDIHVPSKNDITTGVDNGVHAVARPAGVVVKRGFDGFMDGVEATTVQNDPKK